MRALAPFRRREEASSCLSVPSCFVQCSKLKTTAQRNKQQQKTGEGRKMLALVEVGRDGPTPAGGFVIAVHYSAFRLRFFLLEEERGDWAKPVPFPLCGLYKLVFAYWQPRLSHLQTQHVCRGKMPLGLWEKHFHNLYIRQLLLQFSSGFTSGPICWLCSVQTFLSRPWTPIQLSGDLLPRPKLPILSPSFPFPQC